MTVDEQMENEHGSVGKALRECMAAKMTNIQIAHKYGCSHNFIARKMRSHGLHNDNRTPRPRDGEGIMGITSCESRKAMTAAMVSGEELSRIRLLEQVKTFKPGDPQFDAVAADVMRQRETCQGRVHTELLWKE